MTGQYFVNGTRWPVLITWCVVRRERRSQRRSLLRARSRNDFLEEPAATSGMASRAEWKPGRLALGTGGTRTKGRRVVLPGRPGRGKEGKKDGGETHEQPEEGKVRAHESISTPYARRVTRSFLSPSASSSSPPFPPLPLAIYRDFHSRFSISRKPISWPTTECTALIRSLELNNIMRD